MERIIYRFAKKRDEESESQTAAPETAAESERRTCRGSATELTFAMRGRRRKQRFVDGRVGLKIEIKMYSISSVGLYFEIGKALFGSITNRTGPDRTCTIFPTPIVE